MKFKIAVVGPFTGPRSCYGDMLRNQVFWSKYSEYFDFIFMDDKANSEVAAYIAKKLTNENVSAVLGHLSSQSAASALKVYPESLPVILPTATAVALTQHKNAYRVCATDLQQAQTIRRFLERISFRKCYVWLDPSEYAQSIYQLIISPSIAEITPDVILKDNDVVIFLGAHYNIVNAMHNLKINGTIYAICCDDCSIREFKTLTAAIPNIKKYVINPTPRFRNCIAQGLGLVYELLVTKDSHRNITQENPAAKFEILQL